MWIFDKLISRLKTIPIMELRIKDLERTIEVLTGSNTILERELGAAKEREANLLDKIFILTGVNKQSFPSQQVNKNPISIGGKVGNWAQTKLSLEQQARVKYWEAQKKEKEKETTDTLEKELGILEDSNAN